MNILDLIKKVIPEEKQHLLKGNFHLQNDLGIDSLAMINLLLSIEDSYDIEIDYENLELEHFETYESIKCYIESLTS